MVSRGMEFPENAKVTFAMWNSVNIWKLTMCWGGGITVLGEMFSHIVEKITGRMHRGAFFSHRPLKIAILEKCTSYTYGRLIITWIVRIDNPYWISFLFSPTFPFFFSLFFSIVFLGLAQDNKFWDVFFISGTVFVNGNFLLLILVLVRGSKTWVARVDCHRAGWVYSLTNEMSLHSVQFTL